VRTYAGPIVRVTVTKISDGGFEGTVHPDDDRRTYLAGVPECPPGYVSIFHDHLVATREEYEREDWSKWITRIEKKVKKK
jgi:hypothetical protein